MAKILFVSKQRELIKKIAQEFLNNHFIDDAASLPSVKHYLRGANLEYDLIIIDNRIDGGGTAVFNMITSKFPYAKIVGISENLNPWPESPGTFHHVRRYVNTADNCPAWKKEDFQKAFTQLGL